MARKPAPKQPDQIVSHCNRCLFEQDESCNLADRWFIEDEGNDGPPEWCPLREGPLTFRLATEDDDIDY